jgi:hypothetical protein
MNKKARDVLDVLNELFFLRVGDFQIGTDPSQRPSEVHLHQHVYHQEGKPRKVEVIEHS